MNAGEEQLLQLNQGDRVDVGIQTFGVGLGWDVEIGVSQYEHDLDAWAFLLGPGGQVPDENYVVFFNNHTSPDGAVVITPDHRLGRAPKPAGVMAPCEIITVDLGRLDDVVTEIVFAVGIYKAGERKQNFGQVRDSFIRIHDAEKDMEICRYELHEDFSVETALEFGRLYKTGDSWQFEALGIPIEGGMLTAVKKYARNHDPTT